MKTHRAMRGVHRYPLELIEKIDTVHYPNGSAMAWADQRKRERAMLESGSDLYAHHMAVGLGHEGNKITSVEARDGKSHIIDPHCGRPVAAVGPAYARATSCAEADGLATARYVKSISP